MSRDECQQVKLLRLVRSARSVHNTRRIKIHQQVTNIYLRYTFAYQTHNFAWFSDAYEKNNPQEKSLCNEQKAYDSSIKTGDSQQQISHNVIKEISISLISYK